MATTLWKIPFQAVNGDDYRVEIKVEVGAGTAATLIGGASPIVTEEDDDDDLFVPVRTQSGYIQFVDDGSNLGAIMPSSSTDRMVMLYKRTGPYFPGNPTGWTGELVWKGYLQPQSFSGEYLRSPQIRELPICCPLSVLDSWDVEVGVSSGFTNFAGVLHYIFSKLGTADPSSSDEGYWFAFHAGNQTVNWLSKRVLWDSLGGEDEEGNAEAKYTCLELLEHVCNFFGWICRIEGKTVYFSTPDFNNGEFKRMSLAGLADIANGSTPSMSSVMWFTESLDYSDVFASRRNTETLVRGIRKATVNAQVDAYDTILEIPFDKIAKSVRSNAVYRNQIYAAVAPEGDDPGRPPGYFYWRFIPYLAGHRFGNVRITTNRGNSGGNDTKHFQGRIDDYEFYEGGTKDKHNYALTTDLYIVGMAGKTQTSTVVINEPTGLIINDDTADNQHGGWIHGDNTQPDTIGQVTVTVNALATIETVRSVVLSCGVLVLEGTLQSEYVRNGHTSVSPTGTLSVRVSVGDNYYIYLGDGDGYWSQNPDATTKETDCWLDVPVKDGVIATTRVLTAPYPAYEGFGMLVHAPGGNVTRVEGKVKVEIRGWEPKTEEPTVSGTIYNRDDEGDSTAPSSSYVHFGSSDTNVHISSLSLKFLRHNNFLANAERSSNKYTAAGSNLFRDTKTVNTIWYTDNGNNYGKGIVMEANGGYLQRIYFGTTDDRPEQHLANRIATYYGITRRLYRLDLIMDSMPTLTPSKYLKIYGGITTYPVALKRDWRDNRCEVTALLMAGSGNHAPNDPERPEEETVPVTVNLSHVIVKNDIPDVVEMGGTLSLELEAEPGYQITSVVATVGGDVAEDVWDEEWGLLMIWNIEYEVVVTAVAVEIVSDAHSVTTNLTNITSDAPESVDDGDPLTVNLTADTGHYIDDSSVVVMMGNTDITSTAYSNGVVTIAEVTGDVSITAGTMFDAQVEYLQGDGAAYIDTGIDFLQNTVTEISVAVPSIPSSTSIFWGAFMDKNPKRPAVQAGVRSEGKWHITSAYPQDMSVSGATHLGNITPNTLYTITVTYAAQTNGTNATAYIFARNSDSDAYLPCNVRIYGLKITRGGTLIRDFIPVRKNGVGYLYDQVSGTLFGNAAASGAFTYGNDVSSEE